MADQNSDRIQLTPGDKVFLVKHLPDDCYRQTFGGGDLRIAVALVESAFQNPFSGRR